MELPVRESPVKQYYTRAEACRLVGISQQELRRWEAGQLIQPKERFTLPDLTALRSLARLRKQRISVPKIRMAVAAIRRRLTEVEEPFRDLAVSSEGRRICVHVGGQPMDALSGQLLFQFEPRHTPLLRAFPAKTPHHTPRETAERWFQIGLELEQKRAPVDEIIAAYQKAIEADERSAGALLNLGTIYFHRRQWDKAEQLYERALAIDPQYALAHFNLANLKDEQGDYEAAVRHYQRAIAIHPQYADAHYNLALLYQNAGAYMEALRHWGIYLKLDPNSEWAAVARREMRKLRQAATIAGRRQGWKQTTPESS